MRRVGVLLIVAMVAACSGGSSGSSPTSAAPSVAAKRELVPSPCPFTSPPGHDWECSTLIVPTDRKHPDGPHVLLPVAVLRSHATDRLPDPIVYFNGGPGDDTLAEVAGFFADFAADGRRDIIIFDQRGTGGSRPSLDCPEAEMTQRANLATADTVGVEQKRGADADAACRARLLDRGVDLGAYNTPTTADDAEDVRLALGVRSWNLIGVSYGTTVALEVARRHPASVRSVVLDSVFAPDVDPTGTRVVAAAARSFRTLFDGCKAAPTCAAAHPDPESDFFALVADWDAHPFELDVTDPVDDAKLHMKLTGSDLVAGLHQALYDSSLIPVLPSLIAPVGKRDDAARAIVSQFVVTALNRTSHSAEGIAGIVNCADRQRLHDDEAIISDLLAARPVLRTFVDDGGCPVWKVPSVEKAFNTIPASKLRLLALAGEYDPITPPADTERVSKQFTGSSYVLFPGLGHGELFSHDCPRSIIKAFIDAPTKAPDTSCVAQMGPPPFADG